LGAYKLKHDCASMSALMTRNRTRFYFDSNTARQIVSLICCTIFESLYWQGVVWFIRR